MPQNNIPDFIGELDAGLFENKLATALAEVALGVLANDKQGKSSEEDTTATPMYVHKGGVLSVTPEKTNPPPAGTTLKLSKAA